MTAHEQQSSKDTIHFVLAKAWSHALGDDGPFDVRDRFVDRGGHSLLALHIASSLSATFETKVPVETVLTNPTFGEQAAAVEAVLRPGS